MDADGGVDEARVPRGELEGGLRRGEVPARDEKTYEAGGFCARDDGLAVRVELRMLEMDVRVNDARQARGGSATAQRAASRSMRGKMGAGDPVCQSSGPPPQASSTSMPGPPAPRSS
jgi:hypothetical protein